MNKINIGLIGYGNVGQGVVKHLRRNKTQLKEKYNTDFSIMAICDRSLHKKNTKGLSNIILTKDTKKILNHPDIHVVIELIGGLHPAKEIAFGALRKGKHVITANKNLISNCGKELFQEAHLHNRNVYYESSVMAGVPIIRTITEGLSGNKFNSIYGIINGTCNYILSEMSHNNYSFKQALLEAQKRGFAESDPTLDINGMDSTHKLAILVSLAFGKSIKPKDIHTEGIVHISHADIEYAESLGLTIKLLAIAKRENNEIEARVHPTLISKEHPLASINGIFNAAFLHADPLGDILLSGEGAGQMAAALGVVSDLMNLSSRDECSADKMLGNIHQELKSLKVKKIDQIQTKFYLRFMATDKPGVLSKITGVLGNYGISINSVTQKAHNTQVTVPVVMLTDYAPEKMVRQALEKIYKLSIVKSKPVAIRMEKLP